MHAHESVTREIKIRLCNSMKEKGSHIGLEMKAGLMKRSVQAFHYWSPWIYKACIQIPLFIKSSVIGKP